MDKENKTSTLTHKLTLALFAVSDYMLLFSAISFFTSFMLIANQAQQYVNNEYAGLALWVFMGVMGAYGAFKITEVEKWGSISAPTATKGDVFFISLVITMVMLFVDGTMLTKTLNNLVDNFYLEKAEKVISIDKNTTDTVLVNLNQMYQSGQSKINQIDKMIASVSSSIKLTEKKLEVVQKTIDSYRLKNWKVTKQLKQSSNLNKELTRFRIEHDRLLSKKDTYDNAMLKLTQKIAKRQDKLESKTNSKKKILYDKSDSIQESISKTVNYFIAILSIVGFLSGVLYARDNIQNGERIFIYQMICWIIPCKEIEKIETIANKIVKEEEPILLADYHPTGNRKKAFDYIMRNYDIGDTISAGDIVQNGGFNKPEIMGSNGVLELASKFGYFHKPEGSQQWVLKKKREMSRVAS